MIIITPCPADLGYCRHGAVKQRSQANLELPGPRMPHPPVPFSLEGVLFIPWGDASPGTSSYSGSSGLWIWTRRRKDFSVVGTQPPPQLGKEMGMKNCVQPVLHHYMWGARSPPCLVPGNHKLSRGGGSLDMENPPPSCCEEDRAVGRSRV